MNRYRKIQWIGLSAVLALLAGYFVYTHWIDIIPYYAVKYDPEMQYFLNSLALFKGVSYAYIDHPGTPLEVVGTFLLALTRPLTRGQGELFIPFHLANPQLFTILAHSLLAILSFITVVILVLKSWPIRGWGTLIASIGVGVAYFAAYAPLTYRTLDWWTHNAFNFSFGTLLMMVIILRIRKDEPLHNLEILFFGVLAGVLVSVQLYFVAWAFGIGVTLVLFAALRERNLRSTMNAVVFSSLGSVLGFYLGFSPVLHRFRSFFLWVQRLISHQGRYGQGPEGVTTPGLFFDNLRWLWNRGEVVILVSAIALVLIFYALVLRRGSHFRYPGWWAATVGAVVQFVSLWILVGKHPGVNYLISVAALVPVLLFLALQPIAAERNAHTWILIPVGSLLIGLFLVSLVIAVKDQRLWLEQVIEGDDTVEMFLSELAQSENKKREDLVILWGYGVPSRCFSLRYANAYTEGYALRDEIDDICPNEWMYDVWGGYVELPTAYEPLSENSDWDVVVLPERFIPDDSEGFADVIITDVLTRGYGRISILVSD